MTALLRVSLPGRPSLERRIPLAPDRTLRAVFDDLVAASRGTEWQIPLEFVFERDGVRSSHALNWEFSCPVDPDGCLVVAGVTSDPARQQSVADGVSGYDQMMLPADVPVSALGLPDGILILVEDWVALGLHGRCRRSAE